MAPSSSARFRPGLLLPLPSLALVLLLVGAPGLARELGAQHVEDPVVPRGAFLFQVGGGFHQAPGAFADQGSRPFGLPFFAPVNTQRFPAFRPLEEEMRELTSSPGLPIRLGTVRGHFEVNEQVLPLRVGYGLMDRLSLGVTVPFVRRRTDAHLLLAGEGANLGVAPGSQVRTAFRAESAEALEELGGSVAMVCQEEGEGSERCQSGRDARARISGFLELLDSLWGMGAPFPLEGTDAGSALVGRWGSLRDELAQWGVQGPESIPLSDGALDEAFLGGRVVDPVWGSTGFPTETPEAFMVLGDVEAHLGVGLLRLPPEGSRPGLRSGVEVTARFATGTPDSLSLVTPLEPPRGYAGAGVRWVTDAVLAEERIGLLLTLEWSTFLDREVILLATVPEDPWAPETRREFVSGSPGDRIRLGVTPRWAIAPGLFLGGGYEWARGSSGRWTAGTDAAVRESPSITQHLGVVELRLAGWSSPLVEELRFPVELSARGSWAFAGGEGSPRERRVEMGVRVLRRR